MGVIGSHSSCESAPCAIEVAYMHKEFAAPPAYPRPNWRPGARIWGRGGEATKARQRQRWARSRWAQPPLRGLRLGVPTYQSVSSSRTLEISSKQPPARKKRRALLAERMGLDTRNAAFFRAWDQRKGSEFRRAKLGAGQWALWMWHGVGNKRGPTRQRAQNGGAKEMAPPASQLPSGSPGCLSPVFREGVLPCLSLFWHPPYQRIVMPK
jgi:hypothetical protein